jgi:hypothetical protein
MIEIWTWQIYMIEKLTKNCTQQVYIDQDLIKNKT